ncbi:MAG: YidC/Oxa1 family insertase periplasmic-domain containing protein [Phycisphaerales bacterium]|nr:YidC/Oxa1 family insertase periplasmic-domain containing protein [Phycisphaerales bacterium]MCB9841241.1 YidC/Oxa1 family insertase periplasmic-domain containing protein [Phycisphaeraceae bacterium]
MPNQKNPLVRVLVPLIVGLAGVGVVASFWANSKPKTPASGQPASQPTPASNQPQTPEHSPEADRSDPSASQPTAEPHPAQQPPTPATQHPPASTEPSTAAPPTTPTPSTLFARASTQTPADWSGIGAAYHLDPDTAQPIPGLLDETSPYELRIEFSQYGAGIEQLLLAHHHTTWRAEQSQPIQVTRQWIAPNPDGTPSGRTRAASPMAAAQVFITENGTTRSCLLWAGPSGENVWNQVEAGESFAVFEATVVEAGGAPDAPVETPLLTIRRRYALTPNSYVVAVSQDVINRTTRPLDVQVQHFGPIDLVPDTMGSQVAGYGGDKRRVRFGYLASAQSDPTQQFVVADNDLRPRRSAITAANRAASAVPSDLWPTQASIDNERTLVWAGMTNRYFGVAIHTLVDPTATRPDKGLIGVERIEPLVATTGIGTDDQILAMRITQVPVRVEPGATASSRVGMFAGPLSRPVIERDPIAAAAGLGGMVVYNFGGFCAPCTFSWITGPLISLLRAIHTYVTQDWALAIIVLVFIVRGVLHPVQHWSQIRTQRFAKQMQSMAPKQKKLQERYKDDKAALQKEMAKLWREEGITPASFVGCIPPFLQTPIWIALSAMIYFAVELRHEAAFFGAFQMITADWPFMADLSEADSFIPFGQVFKIPLLGIPVSSLNILPFVLALVFYSHQKYFTPPTSATMTPEQKQAQVLSKWLMVVMFPVFMYSAPSGFTLYFIANSTIAIFQTRWIKKHIEKHGLDDPEKAKALAAARRKAVSNSDSFLARMAKRVEAAQQARQGNQPGPGKAMQRRPDRADEPPRRFKDR